MNRNAPRRGAAKGSPLRSIKRPQSTGKKSSAGAKTSAGSKKQAGAKLTPTPARIALPPIRLGFVRGVAPSKWAERWARAVREQPLELVPVDLHEVEGARAELDMLLERVAPGTVPAGSEAAPRTRHAMRLYEETVALVVPEGHELAELSEIGLEDLSLVTLLAHPDHFSEWPEPQEWKDPLWMPRNAKATLELVATGLGGALMAQPMARHLANKRVHAVIPVTRSGASLLPGTEIWASWRVERDGNDLQHLVGVLRGRTARSSR